MKTMEDDLSFVPITSCTRCCKAISLQSWHDPDYYYWGDMIGNAICEGDSRLILYHLAPYPLWVLAQARLQLQKLEEELR